MRIFILLIFVNIELFAQPVIFPLHIGDRWQYIFSPMGYASYSGLSVCISKDTIMQNGQKYAVLLSNGTSEEYLRQSGDSVFLYDAPNHRESLWYNFSSHVGDTISSTPQGTDTIDIILTNTYSQNWYGGPRRSWTFYVNRRHIYDDEYRISISDSIGMTGRNPNFGDPMSLTGAMINGKTYGAISSVEQSKIYEPHDFVVYQNYPNPFNPSTNILFSLPHKSFVSLKVFDLLGREVATIVSEEMSAGTYSRQWNAGNMPTGIYFYRLQAGSFVETKKLVLLR
jgi:hypothetical protein